MPRHPRSSAPPRLASLAIASLTLLSLTACGPRIRLTDSVDNDFDLRISWRYDDRLHGPYVAGAQFRIYAYDITENNDLNGWTIVSLDPDVLDVMTVEVFRDDLDDEDKDKSETDVIRADVIAVGPGRATLEVRNEHDVFIRATEVEVMQPDRIELHAAGPLFIERQSVVPSEVDETPLILTNGTATFLVDWFAGSQKLSGAGALSLWTDHPQGTLWERQSYLDEDRDWATMTFDVASDGEPLAAVEFSANGVPVETVDVEIVQPDRIAIIDLVDESTSGADDGELLAVLARALDDSGEDIWGVAFDWDIDGNPEEGEGDLFRYWYDPSVSSVLGAEYNNMRGETIIAGDEGFVATSNDISCFCSANEDRPGRGIGLGMLCLLALGLVRRRRSDD